MKIRLHLFAVAVLMFFCVVNGFSQEEISDPLGPGQESTKIFLGPVAGYNNVEHSSAKLSTFTGDDYCPSFTGGTGKGFYVGLTYEHHLGKKLEESISSIIGRVMFSMYPGSMSQTGDKFPSLVKKDGVSPTDWEVVESETQHTLSITYNVVAIEVMYKQNFLKEVPLGITAGPTFEIPIQKNVLQEYNLLSPSNAQFVELPKYKYTNGGKTVIVKDGEIENAAGLRIGLKFGLQYEIIIGEGYYIVPSVYYNWGLLDAKTDEDYRINILQAGIDIRFAI